MQVIDRAKGSKKTLTGQLVLCVASQVREQVPFLSPQFYRSWERQLSPISELLAQAMQGARVPVWSL